LTSNQVYNYPVINIEKFESMLILSLNNRFDQLAICVAGFLHNYKNLHIFI